MIELTIDGITVEAAEGQTIFEAAQAAGIEIPTLCHDPKLKPVGVCRLCAVDVGERTLTASCVRKIERDMKVTTQTDEIRSHRRTLVDLLMADQPDPQSDARESALGDNQLLALAHEFDAWGAEWKGPDKE